MTIHRTNITAAHRAAIAIALLIIVGIGHGVLGTAAQDAAPADLTGHPLVGTWIVDTNVATDNDPPEIGIFTADGTVFGLGANRWVSGAWGGADDRTGDVTMAGVFDANGGGYVVLRGPHQVDETGDGWTCDCTFTVVAADGTVLDSGAATALAVRLPMESAAAAGMPLAGFPTWNSGKAATATASS